MRNKTTPGLSAGSMADIAFLLLIFFLVATTVDEQQGFNVNLPPLSDAPPMLVEESDVLAFSLNKAEGILHKGSSIRLEEMEQKIFQFYRNGGILQKQTPIEGIPIRQLVSKEVLETKLRESGLDEFEKRKLKQRLNAIQQLGSYYELPPKAFVMFTFDSNLQYEDFIQVQEVFNSVLDQLRDDIALKKIGVSFEKLDPTIKAQRTLKEAIQTIFPKRYVETIKKV